ncbi:hypothetical protein [uncultured Flavobacterium sp.]|uniref:hypothetical protein n=1 Tax=uncultured Flavobacterium sp. TaxID=165435 RepID=UPI0025E6A423|nr:hypothetical protein [uncultured Flavobacterium sp.]
MRLTIPSLLLISILIFSCNDKKKDEITLKEIELEQREQELLAKETEYNELLSLRDSLRQIDSLRGISLPVVLQWPDSLAGEWSGKMLCRESSCKNYVIGDQRSEKWLFSSDSLGLVVNVMDNEKLKRQLRAELTGSTIRLSMATDTTAINKISIEASLDEVRSKLIRGSQSLKGKDACIAKFSVELTPISKR